MSKALVIRGADFSANAVAQVDIELPYDAEISYLQGDGTAYIKSGISAKWNTQFEIGVNITESAPTVNGTIFGSRVDTNEGNLIVYLDGVSATKKWNWRYGAELHEVVFEQRAGDYVISNLDAPGKLDVVGNTINSYTNSDASFTNGLEIYILSWNNSGTGPAPSTSGNTIVKLKFCKIYQNGQLVRNYIPVRVGQVGYLYDKVSRELFGNAAESGAFVLGPDK
jgi:hypothetical protein